MFKAWTIVDNLLGGQVFGHHFWEPTLLAEELRRRGTEVTILGHSSITGCEFPLARVMPVFPLHHDARISHDPEWGYLEDFILHNVSYQRALDKVDRAVFSDALTLFLNVSERHLLGAIRWLARFEEPARPQVAMILKGQYDWSEGNPGLEKYAKIWNGCAPSLRDHIKVCARSELSAQKYEHILGVRPHILPSALAPTKAEIASCRNRVGPQSGPLVVSFLAGGRLERGTALIPDVVKLCAPLGVRFMIQATDRGSALASLRALHDRPEVHFHEGMLPRDAYNDWIARSVVLLAYNAARYQSRSSGVYLEAKCLGAPVIVARGTWMAEEVSQLGNGVVLEEQSAAAIVQGIARAQADLAGLRERAAAAADNDRWQEGADRCVAAIESLFDQG